MAGVYSDVDFNRMQEQLLQLREVSYRSQEKCKSQEKEIASMRENIALMEKELYKANQIINRSRRAKEYETALHEMDSLQKKLHDHEEDSRLQNETLMKELAQLVGTNENLERELKELKEKQSDRVASEGFEMVKREEHQALKDELRRLQAKYSALLKCNKGQHNRQPSLSIDDVECKNNSNNEAEEDKEVKNKVERQCSDESSNSNPSVEDLYMKLTIEKEENCLLKKQIGQLESKDNEELDSLRRETERLMEKLKKKQESLLQLQEAKDSLFTEMSSKLEAERCEREKLLKESQEKLSQEYMTWKSSNKNLEDDLQLLKRKHTEVLNEKRKLEEQIVVKGQEATQGMKDLQLEFEMKIKKQAEIILALKDRMENLKVQLKESQSLQQQTAEENSVLRAERDSQTTEFIEVTKVADKRKCLLDQLAMKYQEESNERRDQLRELKKNHESMVASLERNLSELKVQLKELKVIEEEYEGLKERFRNVENTKNDLEQSLKDAEARIKLILEDSNLKCSEVKRKHESQMSSVEEERAHETQEFEKKLIAKDSEIAELKEIVGKYEQMVKDHEEDKKLHEKKGSTVVKDLRRQLHSERRRCEKLQEKLQEILSESKNRQSVEDLFRPIEDRLRCADNSSLSSWSPSGLSRDNLTSQCSLQGTDEEPDVTSLRQENDGLVRRVGELLLRASTLEEKVSHLESSNASMAEDLLQKTAVIDHYNMDSKAGQTMHPSLSSSSSSSHPDSKMSLRRVVKDLVTDRKEDDRRDMSRRLQRILEETLTKNMHLQNDLERLTEELFRLKGGQDS